MCRIFCLGRSIFTRSCLLFFIEEQIVPILWRVQDDSITKYRADLLISLGQSVIFPYFWKIDQWTLVNFPEKGLEFVLEK